ncbi:DNA gyrase inhibitor YacG [Vannielia litorea]|uniref:DNA gyrase inhibitor YacG n=1 Tax=Vannielia litorea TaxID=1217970 RepID=UPI001BCE3E23|nr:DNA gyrase inhibitor YacG [Vannielia litorea]
MTCPICSKDTDPKYRPFCSRRCADLDLGKWLTGAYAVPSNDPEDTEEALRLSDEEQPPKPH